MIVCDQNSKDCMLGACSKCPIFDALKPKESINGITWWQWNSNENSRVEKLEFTGEIADRFEQLLFSETHIHQEKVVICI